MEEKNYYIECGKGWEHLYKPVIDYIEKYNEEHQDNPIEIMQIKEKFAGLRIYTNFGTKELHEMIEDAEMQSYNTCECCGKYIEGAKVDGGWYYALCDDCFNEMVETRKKTFEEFKKKIEEKKK